MCIYINMSFQEKYLKYKNKYLSLKNNSKFNQSGGTIPVGTIVSFQYYVQYGYPGTTHKKIKYGSVIKDEDGKYTIGIIKNLKDTTYIDYVVKKEGDLKVLSTEEINDMEQEKRRFESEQRAQEEAHKFLQAKAEAERVEKNKREQEEENRRRNEEENRRRNEERITLEEGTVDTNFNNSVQKHITFTSRIRDVGIRVFVTMESPSTYDLTINLKYLQKNSSFKIIKSSENSDDIQLLVNGVPVNTDGAIEKIQFLNQIIEPLDYMFNEILSKFYDLNPVNTGKLIKNIRVFFPYYRFIHT